MDAEKFNPYIAPVEIGADNADDLPSWALSNFTLHSFVLDSVMCASMEGFLQSLKYEDRFDQMGICAKHGLDAKRAGKHGRDWKADQTLYWQGKPIPRDSDEFDDLITRAFDERFKNPHFRWALFQTIGRPLHHSIGKRDKTETVLTEQEFIAQLQRLRGIIERSEATTLKI